MTDNPKRKVVHFHISGERGSGKTTLALFLKRFFSQLGWNVTMQYEHPSHERHFKHMDEEWKANHPSIDMTHQDIVIREVVDDLPQSNKPIESGAVVEHIASGRYMIVLNNHPMTGEYETCFERDGVLDVGWYPHDTVRQVLEKPRRMG